MQQFLQQVFQMRVCFKLCDQQGEFITTHARHGVVFPHTRPQSPGCFHEQQVARVVPHGVIDFLEVVQVNEEDGHLATITPVPLDLLLDTVLEGAQQKAKLGFNRKAPSAN